MISHGTTELLGVRNRIVLVVVCSLVVAGCSSTSSRPAGSTAAAIGPAAPITVNESRFGLSPRPDPSVVYQPDVVLVAGGAEVVKSVSADGMVWTMSGASGQVADLRPGKIMVASGLGAGRVLAVRAVGSDRQIVVGPAGLTDIVRDGQFHSSAPVSLDHVQAFSTPSRPGLVTSLDETTQAKPTGLRRPVIAFASAPSGNSPFGSSITVRDPFAVTLPGLNFVAGPGGGARAAAGPVVPTIPATGELGTLPLPTPTAPTETVGAYTLSPFCCSGGLGVHLAYRTDGLKVFGTLTMHLQQPSVTFNLRIAGGNLVDAAVELHGAAGIAMNFSAASEVGVSGNVARQRIQVPVAFTVPLFGLPLPISVRVEQTFSLSTGFSERATFSGSGDYSFGGTLGFGIHNGSAAVDNPTGFAVTKKLMDSMQFVSAGPAAMILGYQAKLSVGVGLLGFAASAWVALEVAFAVGAGSSLVPIACRTAGLTVSMSYGVGYQIPQPVADLVNVFLRIFQARPIKASGGLSAGPVQVLHKQDTEPEGNACV